LLLLLLLLLQVGAGGGMKGGVNIWKALRDTHSMHPAWLHCAGRPYRYGNKHSSGSGVLACCL
jgi:hypothetical protein